VVDHTGWIAVLPSGVRHRAVASKLSSCTIITGRGLPA
jgi:hypothetical protein